MTFKGKKYAAAVSGGPDSMALLHLMGKRIALIIHVNYKKRADSDTEQRLVEEFAATHRISTATLECTPEIYKKYQLNNFQALARQIRLDFMNETLLAHPELEEICVAHNLDDFIESAIMQSERGSETLFLGIRKHSKVGSLRFYRPLLNYRKATLERICKQNHIPYGIDQSNFSDLYLRNRIRKDTAKWPNEKLWNFLREIKKQNRRNWLQRRRSERSYLKWVATNYSIAFFLTLPAKVKGQLLYVFLSSHASSRLSSGKISLLQDFIIKGRSGTLLRLGNGIWATKEKGLLKVVSRNKE